MKNYILKKYNISVLSFTLENDKYNTAKVTALNVISDTKDFPERVKGDMKTLLRWLKHRMIPQNRTFVHEILSSQNIDVHDLQGQIDVCKGLSVNDPFWVVSDDFNGKWEEYNLYDNHFSDVLSLVAFTGYGTSIKELSPSPEMTTNGQLPKSWRRIDNKLILFKGGTDTSLFTNGGKEPYSEYYASQVANCLGVTHVYYDLQKWKGILASTCENFTNKDVSYVPMGNLLSTFDLKHLEEKITELGFIKEFKEMILFDAMINNEDRHYGNFGLLKNNHTNEYISMAPLFDHGISLFSHLIDEKLQDKKQFEEYKLNHNNSPLGGTHHQLVKWFCEKEDILKLRNLYNFKFQKHEKYNLIEARLNILQTYIQDKARKITRDFDNEKNSRIENQMEMDDFDLER